MPASPLLAAHGHPVGEMGSLCPGPILSSMEHERNVTMDEAALILCVDTVAWLHGVLQSTEQLRLGRHAYCPMVGKSS